jgi:hypothetical protein
MGFMHYLVLLGQGRPLLKASIQLKLAAVPYNTSC